MNQQYPSLLLQKAVDEFSKLPGIGKKTAMRLVLHLLRQETSEVDAFGKAIVQLKHEVKYCKVCHNISDTDLCQICANPSRDSSTICVVESIQDVMGVVSCTWWCYFAHGWDRSVRFANRQFSRSCIERRCERSYLGLELDHGRRYDELLHLS